MERKGDFIKRQQAIKEKERMYVPLEQMLVFGAQLIQDIDAVMPKQSVSGFHQHFKSVTATSPLQFQKQIRLQDARCLMLGEDLDAASAGFRVGYEDPAYFSREYKNLFGAPAPGDIAKLRGNLEV